MFLFINPACDDYRCNSQPLGLCYVATIFKKYGPTKIFDMHFGDTKECLLECFINNSIDFAGITVSTDGALQAISIARWIRSISPNTIIAIGGPHATFSGEAFLARYYDFDMAFVGDGEIAAAKIAENIVDCISPWYKDVPNIMYRDIKGFICTAPHIQGEMRSIPLMDRSMLHSPLEMARKYNRKNAIVCFETSRGCYGQCTFCALSVDTHRRYKCRPLPQIDAELKQIENDNQGNPFDLYINDADFLAVVERADRIIDIMSRYNIRCFTIATRVTSVLKAKDFLDKLFKSGCSIIEIGVESVADTQLERYGKNITRTDIYNAMDILRDYQSKYSFNLTIDMIMFDPFVSINELKQNCQFLQKYCYGKIGDDVILYNKLALYPGTKITQMAKQHILSSGDATVLDASWIFKDRRSANVYAAIYAFKELAQKKISQYRTQLCSLIYSTSNVSFRLGAINYTRKINTMIYDYLSDVLELCSQDEPWIPRFRACIDVLNCIEHFIETNKDTMHI